MTTPEKHSKTPPAEKDTLYAKREKIHPRIVLGFFTRLKTLSGIILLGIFYTFPWFQWNDRQAVLFDLPARKFYVFGITFWPQDFIFLTFLLTIAALTLFFFTTLAGRLWCGYACPQTIWTDAFIWMERLVEGDRPQQIKLDKMPLTWYKIRIKAMKHTLWIIFSLFTGFTFVGYFIPIRDVWQALVSMNLVGWEEVIFWMLFYAALTYGNAGWLREQICIYMCPYARFQSAMFDKDTLIIAYDTKRGEPRGARKIGSDHKQQNLGECINCTLCVQVCPVGIDIRNGLQYQCISCSACIDVCDNIMDKMNYPRGLVRYTTEHSLEGQTTHIFRPRMMLYGFILLSLFVGLLYAVSQRTLVDIDIIRDRNTLYRDTSDGMIENIYIIRAMNRDDIEHTYDLSVEGIPNAKLVLNQPNIIIPSGTISDIQLSVIADPKVLKQRSTEVFFKFHAHNGDARLTTVEKARFLGPAKN
jgi:cytochrome c oxidase accessory protein FixG